MRVRCAHVVGLVLALLAIGCRRRVDLTKTTLDEVAIEQRLVLAERALLELDVNRARDLLDKIPLRRYDVDCLRARLAVMLGDCQGAVALLSTYQRGLNPSVPTAPNGSASSAANVPTASEAAQAPEPVRMNAELHSVAEGCARAMAGAEIVVDEALGVWVRFQNDRDRVLLPLIADAAARAASAIGKDLGTTLPRPLRIELVSDLASLSAVTGLPLEAAETTGTIAIARWGKVTLVSPRATPEGFPWQDTLAHELAHLIITRKSADAAPLWLQEGLAKREETRWRPTMPLDAADDAHLQSKRALAEGSSVGIDRLGASIALLPTPQAAEIAYAEVRDFVDYWIKRNGEPALDLLLRDLAGVGVNATERALVSVSGYSLSQWIRLWQQSLREEMSSVTRRDVVEPLGAATRDADLNWGVDTARRLRLAELLEAQRHYIAVADQLTPLAKTKLLFPEIAHRAAYAYLMLGQPAAAAALLDPERVRHLDGTWLAMRGRALTEQAEVVAAEAAFRQSLAFAPTLDKVACRGFLPDQFEENPAVLPKFQPEPWQSLCRAIQVP